MPKEPLRIMQLKKFLVIIWCCGLALGNQALDSCGKDTIILGFLASDFHGIDKNDAKLAMGLWIDEIVKVLDAKQTIRAIIFENLQELKESIRQGKVHFLGMNFIDYFKIKDQVGIEPLLIGTNQGKVNEEYVLVIHKGAPWTGLQQLRGKNLLVEDSSGACHNALLWLDTELLRQRLPASQSFFHSVKVVGKASQAVLPVFFRQVEACLMPRWSYDTMVELNPQVKEQTNIMVVSPPLAKGGVFVVKGIPPDKREFMMATQKVWKSPRAKQLMTLFHTQEVAIFKPADMQSMAKLYEEYARLTKRR